MSFVRPYAPSVRVANWLEDIALEEDKLKEFLRKRQSGDLHLTRTQTLLAQNTAPARTSALDPDGNVYVGQSVVIRHLASESALSALPSVYFTRDDGNLGVSSAPKAPPSRRNVFEIIPFEGDAQGPLQYGQKFYLKYSGGDGGEWYLFTERVSLFGGNAKKDANHQAVILRNSNTGPGSYGTVWQVLCYDPQYRLESEGHPVPGNTPILIGSCSTNQNLALTRQHYVRSEYGLEFETTANTVLNTHKSEEPDNHWLIELSS